VSRRRRTGTGQTLAGLVVALLATGSPTDAHDSEPAQAGREGRAELEALLARQQHDRETRPVPAQPGPTERKPPGGTGKGGDRGRSTGKNTSKNTSKGPAAKPLPAVCIGCGASREMATAGPVPG